MSELLEAFFEDLERYQGARDDCRAKDREIDDLTSSACWSEKGLRQELADLEWTKEQILEELKASLNELIDERVRQILEERKKNGVET